MKIIHQKTIETLLGKMYTYMSDEGICLPEFANQKNIEKQLKSLSTPFNAEIVEKEHLHFKQFQH